MGRGPAPAGGGHALKPDPAHSSRRVRTAHLVGLEVVVQRELQLPQVLRLLLLLAFPFPLRQARFCVVVILRGLWRRRDAL